MTHGGVQYGHHLYGNAPFESPGAPGERRGRVEGVTPLEAFGSGVALEGSDAEFPWDFIADETGDLAATYGWNELRKDLGWRTSLEIKRQKINRLQSDGNLRQIGDIHRNASLSDTRVRSATIEDIRYNGRDSVSIQSRIETNSSIESTSVIPL